MALSSALSEVHLAWSTGSLHRTRSPLTAISRRRRLNRSVAVVMVPRHGCRWSGGLAYLSWCGVVCRWGEQRARLSLGAPQIRHWVGVRLMLGSFLDVVQDRLACVWGGISL